MILAVSWPLVWVVDVRSLKVSVNSVNPYLIVMLSLLLDEHLSSKILFNPNRILHRCLLDISTVNCSVMRMEVHFDRFWRQVKKIHRKLS